MDRKTLNYIYNYLPVITSVSSKAKKNNAALIISNVREFFEILQKQIPLKKIPNISEINSDAHGCITLLWELDIDEKMFYDYFLLTFPGYKIVKFKGKVESLQMETQGYCDLDNIFKTDIIEYLSFFKGKQK